jgi:hypothetical protein
MAHIFLAAQDMNRVLNNIFCCAKTKMKIFMFFLSNLIYTSSLGIIELNVSFLFVKFDST